MQEKKVIFFDLFDTLVTADRGELEPFFTREIDRMGDNGLLRDAKSTIEELAKESPEMIEGTTVDKLAKYYDDRMAMLISNIRSDVLQMLQELKTDGWQLCVISDAARVDIARWSESPLSQYFDNTVFSCDVGYVKPDPRLYEIAKASMGNPTQCVFIGDGGHDELLGAHRAGMATIKAEYIKNRRDESIVQETDIRATNTKKVATLVREIDFGRHQFNYDSPFHTAVRSMIEQDAHASKEDTERMVEFYDSLKLASHQLGVNLGLDIAHTKQLTNEILGQTAQTPTVDYVKDQIGIWYKQGNPGLNQHMAQLIINMNQAIQTGADALEPVAQETIALNQNIEVLQSISDALGIQINMHEIYQQLNQNITTINVAELTNHDTTNFEQNEQGKEEFSQADDLK